jgi:H-type lectin domain
MWTGHGPREVKKHIKFKGTFKGIPDVHVTISMWDMDRRTNMRGDISTADVTATDFTIIFKTWDDTRIARLRVDWMAIGEIPAEDDWDVI